MRAGSMLATDLGASGEDGVVDEVRKESAIPRAWSTGLGVVSCDVCTRTEEFWAPAAWNLVMPSKSCTRTDRGGIRGSERNRGEGNSKKRRRLPSGSTAGAQILAAELRFPTSNCRGLAVVLGGGRKGDGGGE
jgi:hypothetical protein